MTVFLKAWLLLGRLLRVGYVRALLVLDALFTVAIALNAWYLSRQGVGLTISALHIERAALIRFIAILGSAAIGLPIMFALVRVGAAGRSQRHGQLARELTRTGRTFHVVSSVLAALTVAASGGIRQLGGLMFDGQHYRYVVTTTVGDLLAHPFTTYGGTIWTLVSTVVGTTILTYLTQRSEPPRWVREFLQRLELVDLKSDLYPVAYSPTRSNFIGGAVSPGIWAAVTHGNNLIDTYRRQMAGTGPARRFLEHQATKAAELCRELLFPDSARNDYRIAFCPSTSRALELAIALEPGRPVVVSPLEHPTEMAVTTWLETLGWTVAAAAATESMFLSSAKAAAEEISFAIAECVDRVTNKTGRSAITLVISDVCWATGTRTALPQILEQVRDYCCGIDIRIVIDGAHAVGNEGLISHLASADAYVFSGHKWLFSSEPIGILLTRDYIDPAPIDLWCELADHRIRVPHSTAGPGAICQLYSSLKLLHAETLESLWNRSRQFRERLWHEIGDCFAFAGTDDDAPPSESFIVSVYPKSTYRWRDPKLHGLQTHFNQERLALHVIRPTPRMRPLVRVTLPFWLSFRDLDRVARALLSQVERT